MGGAIAVESTQALLVRSPRRGRGGVAAPEGRSRPAGMDVALCLAPFDARHLLRELADRRKVAAHASELFIDAADERADSLDERLDLVDRLADLAHVVIERLNAGAHVGELLDRFDLCAQLIELVVERLYRRANRLEV